MFDVFGFVFVCFCVVASLQEWIEVRLREIQTGEKVKSGIAHGRRREGASRKPAKKKCGARRGATESDITTSH